MPQVVALTGGTGFIGRAVLDQLLAAGHSVRLLARNPATVPLASDRLQIIPGSLQDQSALEKLVVDADVIVHCAGRVRGRSIQEFTSDNVTATQAILDVSRGNANFIYISSLAARNPSLSHYALSKLRAEQAVRAYQTDKWMIIRPPAVYGPGDRELRPLFDWLRRGILWVPGSQTNRFSLLHVTDLAELISHLVGQFQPALRIYEPHDGRPGGYQWLDIQSIAESVFKRKVRRYTVPRAILNTVAYANMVFCAMSGKTPMLTPGKVRELVHSDWVSDPTILNSGWQPRTNFEHGLQDLYTTDH